MQTQLFFEDINDALRGIVQALGGAKRVGERMRPEKGPEGAGRWLMDCLNPERAERLSPEQVLWMLRAGADAGFHDGMRWLATAAGYQPPLPVDPTAELADLTRKMNAQLAVMRQTIERIEKLRDVLPETAAGLRVAK